MTLYVFNPENDMALADGHPGYTPPVQIQQMRRELWWLPQWWAEDEDIVWNGEERLNLSDDTRILPWGWSPALCHQLKQAGVQESLLPSRKELELLRQLSHRQTAVSLLQELRGELPLDGHLAGKSALCRDIKEAEETANAYGEALLKSPWSSSGRGLMKTDNPQWKAWASRILKAQGSVVVEQFLHKVTDFALEFWPLSSGSMERAELSIEACPSSTPTSEERTWGIGWHPKSRSLLGWLSTFLCNISKRYGLGGQRA